MRFPFFCVCVYFSSVSFKGLVFLEMCSVNSAEMRGSPLLYFAFPAFQIVVAKNKQLWKSLSPFQGQKPLLRQ